VVPVPFACERSWANEMRHTSISALHAPGRDEGSGCRSHLPPVNAAKLTPDTNRVESRMGIGMRIAALPGSGGDRAKCTGSGRVGAFVGAAAARPLYRLRRFRLRGGCGRGADPATCWLQSNKQ
jgi:hypothetical protein